MLGAAWLPQVVNVDEGTGEDELSGVEPSGGVVERYSGGVDVGTEGGARVFAPLRTPLMRLCMPRGFMGSRGCDLCCDM